MTIEQRLQACALGDSTNSLRLAQWTIDKALRGRRGRKGVDHEIIERTDREFFARPLCVNNDDAST